MLEPKDVKIATVTQLKRDGIVSDVSIHAMPEKVNLTTGSDYGEFVELYDRLDQWAKKHDVSLSPGFSVTSTSSEIWHETRRTVRMPMICLVLYSGSEVIGVFPHSTDEVHHSVEEALSVLQTGELETILPESSIIQRGPADECPECGGILVNTQGVLCCYDCLWDELSSREKSPPDLREPEMHV
jgi:hypothetical protein